MAMINNKWVQYYFPITLLLFSCFTKKRVVYIEDGGYDRLYGLPLGYISNNVGYTDHYDVYLVPLMFNLICYFATVWFLMRLFEKVKIEFKTHWAFSLFGMFIILFWLFGFYITTQDSSFKLLNDVPSKTISTKLVFNHL